MQQYQTYVITDPTGVSRLEVVPERGGVVTSWQINGEEVFYLDRERFADPTLSVRGGIPILFPICGNLPDNTYTHNGKTYTLKQHGFARELPWQFVSEEPGAITISLTSNAQTLEGYPFEFEVLFTYRLQANHLEIHQRYTNKSAETMPFSTGFHPYFLAPDKTALQLNIPGTEYWDNRTKTSQPYAGSFDFDVEEIDAAFQQLTSQTASVTDSSRQMTLTLTADPAYAVLVFWTVRGKDFFCLENWTGPRNALNTGDSLLHLEPGASRETTVGMTVDFAV